MRKVFTFLLFAFLTTQSTAQRSQFEQIQNKKPFVIGVIEEINSVQLQENRILNIYLPEGYSSDSATLYPVIYLLDGSMNEDFIHVAGLVQFCNFSWVDILPKTIVVGISNVDRRRDFTFPTTIEQDKKDFPTTGGSEKFIAFLEKELQPFIQKNYKTSGDRMLIGQSLGGLLAVEILFKKPSLFNQYLIVSPSLWWDNESLLNIERQPIVQPTEVILAVGREGKVMERDAKKLYQRLKKTDSPHLSAGFCFFKNLDHATIFHQAVSDAFAQFKTITMVAVSPVQSKMAE